MVDPRLKARVEAYYRAFNARAEDAYLACFRPDGAVGGTLTGTPIAGVGVQKAILRSASGGMGDLTMGMVACYQAQTEVAVAWAGEVRESGARIPVHGLSLFEFDEEAKIRETRVFWNPRPLTGEGPVDASNVDADHRQVIDDYFKVFNARNWEALGRLFAEGCSVGGTLVGAGSRGKASLRSVYESAVSNLPGIQMRPLEAFQAQEAVATHWEGEVLASNGLLQPIKGIAIFRFDADGLIWRYRVYWNPRSLLQEA